MTFEEDLASQLWHTFLRSTPDSASLTQGDLAEVIKKAREGMIAIQEHELAMADLKAVKWKGCNLVTQQAVKAERERCKAICGDCTMTTTKLTALKDCPDCKDCKRCKDTRQVCATCNNVRRIRDNCIECDNRRYYQYEVHRTNRSCPICNADGKADKWDPINSRPCPDCTGKPKGMD